MRLSLSELTFLCAFKMIQFQIIYTVLSYLYIVGTEGSSIIEREERGAGGSWSYTSNNGPDTWGGICQTGNKQSPIDIKLGTVIVKNFPPFNFSEDYLLKHKFWAKNNGHTIYVALENDYVQPVIYGGGLENKFIFQQLHLHWESEHEFDGKRADLEMHLVHYNSKYGSFEEASTKLDGLAVLAVIFDESENTENLIEEFFAYILDASSVANHPSHPAVPGNSVLQIDKERTSEIFALRDLLPKHTSRFFRYEGSLTTPGCDEVVQWTVFINRLPISRNVLDAFRSLRDHDGNVLSQNFRPPQKLNDREIFIQIINYDGRPTPEFEQVTNSGNSKKIILSLQILYCVFFLIFISN